MKLEDIGFYTLSDARAAQASSISPLWRCELILSDACNFKCAYCRPLQDGCRGSMQLDQAKHIVNEWGRAGLRNIRFSGGEPTLYKGLLGLVQLSKTLGVQRVAVSTNGSAEFSQYQQLIDAGVDDFSVSLDACCAATGDKMAGREGAWKKVVENIRKISAQTYCTVGIVLTNDNLAESLDIVRFAHALGVADIRVIPAAQMSQRLGQEFIASSVSQEILESHPILRYRMQNVVDGVPVRGLEKACHSRCAMVVDDMAVAGEYHFPCIIYLREGGRPIGRFTDIKTVRNQRQRWRETHDIKKDFICRLNCLDVCSVYCAKWFEFHP